MRKNDLSGLKVGRLTVIKENVTPHIMPNGNKRIRYICLCECGNTKSVLSSNLISKMPILSCGCLKEKYFKLKNIQTNKFVSKKRLYKIWSSMKSRCNNKNNESYKYYGNRGINYCIEWEYFPNFFNWSIGNGYADHLTIERKNVNGNYEPDNCRWATNKEQGYNKRNSLIIKIGEDSMCLVEWCNMFKCSYNKMLWLFKKKGVLLIEDFQNHKIDKRIKKFATIDHTTECYAFWAKKLNLTYQKFNYKYNKLKISTKNLSISDF